LLSPYNLLPFSPLPPFNDLNSISISILFERDHVQLKHKCNHLMHQNQMHHTRVSLRLSYICSALVQVYNTYKNIKNHSTR
jgi:hypothetical protein